MMLQTNFYTAFRLPRSQFVTDLSLTISSIVIEGSGPFFLFLRAKIHLKNTIKRKANKAKTKASKAKAKVSTHGQNKSL